MLSATANVCIECDDDETNSGLMKHKYYCEYRFCSSPDRTLVPFKTKKDWTLRMLHKKCYTEIVSCSGLGDIELIRSNPKNPIFDKCKCLKNNGEPCKMKSNTEGFNKKFGYCKYHNYKKFHDIYK
jgi:hypothetical protein